MARLLIIPSSIALLLLLTACDPGRHERMQQELAELQAMNQADSVLTDDSLAQALADWFDRHGTPNEQMEAHYLLGRTHADRGEAPAAIDCYLDAAACADTTATDCDFYMLASIYGQMATLYHRLLLLTYEIEARRRACRYNYLAGDTLYALHEQKMIAGVYILQNKRDSAEAVLLHTIGLYNQNMLHEEALLTSTMLMHLYSEQPGRLSDLGKLIKTFDEKSTSFDENHDLPPSQRLFFCYKAKYFEGINQLDSAEFYYRKMYHPGMPLTSRDSMYKGLLRIFNKRMLTDSISKFAWLYCAVNDSSIAIKDQKLTARMAASYQYNCIQKESSINAEKARQANTRLFFAIVLLVAIVAVTVLLVFRYKRQRRKQQAKYIATITERAKLQEELESLHAKDYDAIIAQKEQEIAHLGQIIAKHEAAYQSVISRDKLAVFEESPIVKLFAEKSLFRGSKCEVSSTEWEELVGEFSKDMPSAHSLLRCLSTLQLHVCILLLLDYEETVIAILKNTKPQTINNAKARANMKLFQSGDSASLKSNLKRLIVV